MGWGLRGWPCVFFGLVVQGCEGFQVFFSSGVFRLGVGPV